MQVQSLVVTGEMSASDFVTTVVSVEPVMGDAVLLTVDAPSSVVARS